MAHRRVGSHELNLESSRSHSIMTVYIESSPSDPQVHLLPVSLPQPPPPPPPAPPPCSPAVDAARTPSRPRAH